MKINNQVAFALSTLLLSVGTAAAVAQPAAPPASPAPAAKPAASPKPKPASSPASAPLSTRERQELQQRRDEDRIKRFVQQEVNQTFGLTTSFLNVLLFLLILFPVVGIISLWLLRRSLATQIKSEVKEELHREVKGEMVKLMGADLSNKREGSLPPAQPSMTGENVSQLKELITMAMATQNVISDARNSVEESLKTQTKTEELLKNVFDRYMKQGESFFLEGRYEDAIEVYDLAIQSNQEDYEAWCGKGVALTRVERYDEAISAFNQALRINSEYADAWYEKARCYALQGNIDSAIENLRQSVNLNPDKRQIAKTDPSFDAVRDNEWFEDLIAR